MRLSTFFNHLNLGSKLSLTVLLVFGLLLAGVVLTTTNSLDSLTVQTGRQNVEQDAPAIQARLSEIEQEALDNVKFIANTSGLSEAIAARDIQPVRPAMLIAASRFGFDDLDVVDSNGIRLFNTNTIEEEEELLIAQALLGFEGTGIIVEEDLVSLAAVVPLTDTSGAVVGVVFASQVMDNEFVSRVNIFAAQGLHLCLIVNDRIVANDFENPDELEGFSAYMLNANFVEQALNGQTVIANDLTITQYGPHVMGYTPVTVGGNTRAVFGLVFKMDELAAFQRRLVSNQLIVFALITISALTVLAWFISRGILAPLRSLQASAELLASGKLTAQAEVNSKDEIGALADAFNSMAAQLRGLIGSLEQRVAGRTKALAISAEVSRRLSTLLDQERLVKEVVEQVQLAFNYYHAQIYLLDGETGDLIMVSGTGQAGQILLENHHRVPKGRGLVGRAAETSKLVLVADTAKDPDWLPNPHLPGTKSEVAVPITAGGQVLGVLDVQNNVANSLSEQDADLLISIANQVGIALQNARQYQASQKVARELGAVADIAVTTTAITEVNRLLQEAVESIKSAFDLYHVHIYLLNEAGDTLELSASAGEAGRQMLAEGWNIPVAHPTSFTAQVARNRKAVTAGNIFHDKDSAFLSNRLLPNTRSEMAVPLIVGQNVIGVLEVQSEQPNRFEDVDVNIATTLAAQIAVALQNARAFAQIQRNAEYEECLNLITQKIQSAADVDTVLQITARELGSALGATRAITHVGMKGKYNASN